MAMEMLWMRRINIVEWDSKIEVDVRFNGLTRVESDTSSSRCMWSWNIVSIYIPHQTSMCLNSKIFGRVWKKSQASLKQRRAQMFPLEFASLALKSPQMHACLLQTVKLCHCYMNTWRIYALTRCLPLALSSTCMLVSSRKIDINKLWSTWFFFQAAHEKIERRISILLV